MGFSYIPIDLIINEYLQYMAGSATAPPGDRHDPKEVTVVVAEYTVDGIEYQVLEKRRL